MDNLDTGRSVLPILTNYHGPIDCYESCLRNEGISGFYKGFGALILQFTAHIAVVHLTRFLLTEITARLYKPPGKKGNNSPPPITNMTDPVQTYLLP